jgi:hypothetical protein
MHAWHKCPIMVSYGMKDESSGGSVRPMIICPAHLHGQSDQTSNKIAHHGVFIWTCREISAWSMVLHVLCDPSSRLTFVHDSDGFWNFFRCCTHENEIGIFRCSTMTL